MRQQVHTERQQLDGRDRKNPGLSHGSRQPPAQNENAQQGGRSQSLSFERCAGISLADLWTRKRKPDFNSQGSPNRASRCVAAGGGIVAATCERG